MLLAFCWFLAAAVPALYAEGKRDEELVRIETLINQKNYDEAILALSGFARQNPERFREAQRLMRRIYRIKEEYNAVADRLLDVLVKNPDNAAEVLALTKKLEELESGSNPHFQSFLAHTRELAFFNQNRQRLESVLAQGRSLIDQGDFEGALRVYQSGMDIYREEFFAAGYGQEIETQVAREISRINDAAASFAQSAAPLGALSEELARAGQQGASPARLREIFSRLSPVMDGFFAREQPLYFAVRYFDQQLAEFQKDDPGIGDRNFLSFASRLVRGRSGQSVREGMIGAFEGCWNSTAGAAEKAVARHTGEVYAAAVAAISAGDYAAARRDFGQAGEYNRVSLELCVKRGGLRASENLPALRLFDRNVFEDDAGSFLAYTALDEAAGCLFRASEIGLRFEDSLRGERPSLERWQSGAVSTEDALNRGLRAAEAGAALRGEIDSIRAALEVRESELRGYEKKADVPADQFRNILASVNTARSISGGLRERILDDEREAALLYYTAAEHDLRRRLEGRRAEFAEGNRLLTGVSRTAADGVPPIVEYYPAEGLEYFSRMAGALTADIALGDSVMSRFSADPQEIASEAAALKGSCRSMLDEMIALRTRGQTAASLARGRLSQAEAFRQDGERLFREAQSALSGQNFDTARARVQGAIERFNNSLAVQESSSLRRTWDTQVVHLSQEINRIENEIVIRDVRNLVNSARTTYFAGKFEDAEELLVRAQNRWRVTNAGEDEELSYWLRLVRGALSLRSGRVILPTAPLYPEMSQLLSEARKGYGEGARLVNSGSRPEGLVKFAEARRKTREVKLMFPLNQEAGILELRMDQLTDPAAFNSSFAQRLAAAAAGTKRRSAEAFADLQNLAEINPAYPRMAAILRQAEIDMGYRLPPPDPQAVARSAELTALARRTLNANITGQFEIAIAQVNEAIVLNPNNTQAALVKDQLQTRSGTGAAILNSQDEAEYNRALRELQQGNSLVAYGIVQRLLQNPRNRNITKVIDLQRRIQSIL